MKNDICPDGNVTFPSQPETTYRYKVTEEVESVRFWLEDRKNKHQWCATAMKRLINASKVFTRLYDLMLLTFLGTLAL
jgi:hypothetical protein